VIGAAHRQDVHLRRIQRMLDRRKRLCAYYLDCHGATNYARFLADQPPLAVDLAQDANPVRWSSSS
jgi:hypothetical protein